jgi:hypothetical protein
VSAAHRAQPHELDAYRRDCWERTWRRLLSDDPPAECQEAASDPPADNSETVDAATSTASETRPR